MPVAEAKAQQSLYNAHPTSGEQTAHSAGMDMKILVTGGAGFIGSALVGYLLAQGDIQVINLDKLTYAGSRDNLSAYDNHPNYSFIHGDIGDAALLEMIFRQHQPQAVMHLAAESHVDNSIAAPAAFMTTNIMGTYSLLQAALHYWQTLPTASQHQFRFHHVSTDEVYGDLALSEPAATEHNAYHPSSPYAASKASADHLVRAWQRTYGLPTLISNCTNNYGPRQFPEKLIPLMLDRALNLQPLPIYGDGQQIRDWLYVDDHAAALHCILTQGTIGETYNIGGHNQHTNLELVHQLCALLDQLRPLPASAAINRYSQLITHVTDRAGHDRRYALNSTKLTHALHWHPKVNLAQGLALTLNWYLANREWVAQRQQALPAGNHPQ